jgi:hypothetical protein
MIVAWPMLRARTSPAIESTLAIVVSLDRHRNVAVDGPAGQGVSFATARSVSPRCSVAEGGETETVATMQSIVGALVVVLALLHATTTSPAKTKTPRTLIGVS